MIKVVCVLKSSGDYDEKDVQYLWNQVNKYSEGREIEFVCLTDVPEKLEHIKGIKIKTLLYNFEGWWSVQEMFRLTGKTVAFGLDTVITGSLLPLYDFVDTLDEKTFGLLRPFGKVEKWSNGVMCWNGDYQYIIKLFCKNPTHIKTHYVMEHRYTWNSLEQRGYNIVPIQDYIGKNQIVSYKWNCVLKSFGGEKRKTTKPPTNTIVVCFHGKPRPSEVSDKWVVEARGGFTIKKEGVKEKNDEII